MTAPSPEHPLLTLAEVARALGCSKRAVEAWASSGRLPVIRISRRIVRVAPADLAAFLAARREET